MDSANVPGPAKTASEATGTEHEYDASASTARYHRLSARTRRTTPYLPLWEQPRTIQVARAQNHAERLPWHTACRHDDCGSRAIAVICAEDGRPFCREHGGYAVLPVDLARFGFGAEAGSHRSGDFRELPAA